MGLRAELILDFGHDKSRAIRPYAELPADGRPIMVYCGDGVSDIPAAKETGLLFAKKGKDLVTHCLMENIPFYPFDVCDVISHADLDLRRDCGGGCGSGERENYDCSSD